MEESPRRVNTVIPGSYEGREQIGLLTPRAFIISTDTDNPLTPNLPNKIISTKIRWLKLSGKFPMGLGIPPLKIKILLESKPLKSRTLVRRLAGKAAAPA